MRSIKYQPIILVISFVLLTYSCAPVTYEDYTPAVWDTIEYSRSEIIQYLDSNVHSLNPVEGIWNYSEEVYRRYNYQKSEYTEVNQFVYEIAIFKKEFASTREFDAVILTSVDPAWNYPGRVKGLFLPSAYSNQYAVKWYDGKYDLKTINFVMDDQGVLAGNYKLAGSWGEVSYMITLTRMYPPFKD